MQQKSTSIYEDKNMIILQFPAISQLKLSNLSEGDFPEVWKKVRVRTDFEPLFDTAAQHPSSFKIDSPPLPR